MATIRYTGDDLADAILAVTDEGLSQNQAAQRYGIPRRTLSNRISGRGAQSDRIQPNQRINNDYEARIKQWVLRQESLGHGLSHGQIRAAVEALLKQRGDNTPLGVNWVSRLINKHPEIKTKDGRVQETVRFEAFTPKAVN
jgi:transcriptional regulator with XRE-family HTH domain